MKSLTSIFLISFLIPCSCLEPPPPEEAYNDADVVFAGEVSNIVLSEDGYYYEVSFQVINHWKGNIQEEVIILTETSSAVCGYDFHVDSEYLVYAYSYGDEIQTNMCTRTNLLDSAAEDLEFLNGLDEECDYSSLLLTMQDSWGDGWNGNTFCLNDECTTLLNGSIGTYEFCIDLSIENTITCNGGNWQSEVFWTLSDSDGTTLATGGAPFEGCVGGTCENEVIESLQFNDNGQIRDYFFYRPNSVQDNAPLIFVLHGYSGSAGGIMGYSGMNEVASEHGFAVCYPQGTTDQDGYNFWNVGYAFHQNQPVDDVAFLSSLASYLQNEHQLDSQKTFVTGMSNGGDMSYMLACQASDVFRAIAPVAGCMMEDIYNTCGDSPVPVLEIHGTNDWVTLWDGDMQNNDGWGAYYSTQDGIDLWVETNECIDSEHFLLPNPSNSDGSYIINHRYFNCTENAEVWLYEIIGGGHDWPGSSGNMDIQASEEIWGFFSQYTFNIGDVNGDNSIDILDVVQLVTLALDGEYDASGDLNEDGMINVQDIILLINIILNS